MLVIIHTIALSIQRMIPCYKLQFKDFAECDFQGGSTRELVFYRALLTKQICSDSEPRTTVLKDMNNSHSNKEVVSLQVSGEFKLLRKY